ncbi:tRNA pseudouridine(38-40) synthase TruA [Serpentinicella alkaliphila]|uniref:tRNA pseudouridine synthase A n=1 Tax=Serpentinicella alkaliphila TaxID=1734049 RepID=A0A4V2T2J2_9FIRM|nr:tRNA pseudouridine(38-40) synthase TruA [Serpentinicella alkaliphila]QUH26364.1 tRNA pseudouridine(38-40) synthase TruA [Serpentinicella alkaliphila]TCP97613.1 tRNA pseudouridine38-40 synthase [Serpentinicella alkaliphila]
MKNIKLLIEYDGSRYKGWQRLKDSDMTIQGKIESVLTELFSRPIEIIGSGRTDAGVHARGQVANFTVKTEKSLLEIHKYLNHYLPQDIVVKEVSEAPERFHSQYNVKKKKYVYCIWNHWIPSAFNRKYSYNVPEHLNIELMEEAANLLIGTHDFIGFSSVKKSNKSTVRTIEEISFIKEDKVLKIVFVGDGFLHNMVRIIVGTLLEIGLKEKKVSYINEIFESKTRSIAGKTAPAQGLFLEEVTY